jgi:hypothetical protein
MWVGGAFRYNTAVCNVNTRVIHNTYVNRTVINNNINHTSFNGPGGISARPNAAEQSAMHEQHMQPTANQMSHERSASQDKSQFASANHGMPHTTAMNRVNGRAANQQKRIGNGIKNGQINAKQAGRDENKEQNIHQEARSDRQANGGRLNGQQHKQINRQQNHASRQIARQRKG